MNTDNKDTGQQGYGRDQETDRQNQQPQGHQQGQQPQGQQQGQQFGQQAQQQPQGHNAQPIGGNDSNSGSGTTMSSGSSTGESDTGQASYGNSGQGDAMTQNQNRPDQGQEADLGQGAQSGEGGSGFVGSSTDNSSEYLQSGSDSQDFAEQGQGALDEDDDDDAIGTTDIETERSQGRESDIEGSSL